MSWKSRFSGYGTMPPVAAVSKFRGRFSDRESAPSGGNIVCAIDLEKESVRVIESAVMLAPTFSAQVRLVHCVPVPESGPAESFAVTFDRFLADSAREQLMKLQDRAGTRFEVSLEGGSISKVVQCSVPANFRRPFARAVRTG
jgi:hypothetical protein